MPALSRHLAALLGQHLQGVGAVGPWRVPGALYLTLLHDWLLPALGAVARHDTSSEVLAVSSALFHGVGLGVVATAMGGGPALGQAELPAEGSVLLLHLTHPHLQALALPLARGRVPGTVRLGLQRRQRHGLPICGCRKTREGLTQRETRPGPSRSPDMHYYTAKFFSQPHLQAKTDGKWVTNKCIQTELGTKLGTG